MTHLPAIFGLSQADDRTFEAGVLPASGGSTLGSGLLATSVLAAAGSAPASTRPVALQAQFLRAGREAEPVTLTVDSTHDGRALATRTVTAAQTDRVLAIVAVRFHGDVDEAEVWVDGTLPPLPRPEAGSPTDAVVTTMDLLSDFEIRAGVPAGSVERPILHPYWIRLPGGPPSMAGAHAAVLALLTDIGVSGSSLPPDASFRRRRRAVSLDHGLWWHREPRVDRWLHLDAQPLVNHGDRGLVRGIVRSENGELVASFVQETLLRSSNSGPAA